VVGSVLGFLVFLVSMFFGGGGLMRETYESVLKLSCSLRLIWVN